MFSYDEFRSSVKQDGLARQNRFYIQMAMPALSGDSAIVFDNAGTNNRNLHMFCKSISLPGVNVASFQQRETGEIFEAPYDRNFSPVNLTFYVDRNMFVRKFFDDWVNSIQNPFTRELSYYKDFVSDNLTIYVMDKLDLVNYIVILWDVHPKSIGTLNLDQGSNETMTFDVTLDYHYYTTYIVPRTESGKDIPSNRPTNSQSITTANLPSLSSVIKTGGSIAPLDRAKAISSSATSAVDAFQNTIGSTFGTVRNAIAGYQNDFLSFQRQISEGLGVLNGVSSDIRAISNAPRDTVNSAKSTIRDISSGFKNLKSSIKIF